MLSKLEVDKFGPPGFNLGQKEKDYLQHWVLTFLSRTGFSGVFKGGTCLQKAFSLPRYSEDLDFTLNNAREPNLDALAAFLSSAGFANPTFKSKETQQSLSVKLRLHGPMYNGKTVSESTVSLDFSRREKTLLEPTPTVITPPYPDLLAYQTLIMDKKEISAEKIRAILTRNSARDLLDLSFLFKQNAVPSIDLINSKLKLYNTSFDYKAFSKKIAGLKRIWQPEIQALTPNPLDYKTISKQVLEKAREIK